MASKTAVASKQQTELSAVSSAFNFLFSNFPVCCLGCQRLQEDRFSTTNIFILNDRQKVSFAPFSRFCLLFLQKILCELLVDTF